MAKRKLSEEDMQILLSKFDNGMTPANLAIEFSISVSTISRYLKKYGRVSKVREAHQVLIGDKVKSKLRRVLSGCGVDHPDILISELDKNFLISERKDEDFKIIYVD